MPHFCSECGRQVGFFSRRKLRLASGATAVMCKACARRTDGSSGRENPADGLAEHVDVQALGQLAAQYEKMNRWTDLISTLRKKADATANSDEQVEIYSQIAALFVDRFSNQAEAVKAYERVLALEPAHRQAIENLKKMYERRRDWEKLIALCQQEITLFDQVERGQRYLEVARLASTKLKRKSQVAIELWSKVVEYDPQNTEAAQQLEKLRMRRWFDYLWRP